MRKTIYIGLHDIVPSSRVALIQEDLEQVRILHMKEIDWDGEFEIHIEFEGLSTSSLKVRIRCPEFIPIEFRIPPGISYLESTMYQIEDYRYTYS